MTEINIKPSNVKKLYQIIEDLRKGGLNYHDTIKLIQMRTHPQMSLKASKNDKRSTFFTSFIAPRLS